MTNNTPNPAADVAHIRALFDSQQRLVGTLVNEMQDARSDFADRDRMVASLLRRLDAQGEIDKAHTELLAIWSERLSWMEDLFIAHLGDEEERAALRNKVAPLRTESWKRVRNALALSERVGVVTE